MKSLNITSNFGHSQISSGSTSANSRNKTVRSWSQLASSIGKSDSRNYTHAEIRDGLETVTKSKDFNVQSFDRKQHVPLTKDGNNEQKETSLIPLNGKHYIPVTQENEPFGSEIKKKVTVHIDNDQNENVENENARLTDNIYAEDQRSKEEQINHGRDHPHTEKSTDETKGTEEEVTTGDKTRMSFDHGTIKKPSKNTAERMVKNSTKAANSNILITNQNDSNHMREKHLHEEVSHVKSTLKPGSKFKYTAITYSTVISDNTYVREQEVTEEMNKFTNSKISTKPLISIQDKNQNKSVKASLPRHKQNNVFNNTILQPRTRMEPMASHDVQEAKELNVTSELMSDENNEKGTSTAETVNTKIAPKNINVAPPSVKATKDLKTEDVVLNTKIYSTTELTKDIKTITKQRQLVESEPTNLFYENNLAENEKNMSDGPGQCAE